MNTKPVTLRDLRRAIGGRSSGPRSQCLAVYRAWLDLRRPTAAEVDRLIARHGARTTVRALLEAQQQEGDDHVSSSASAAGAGGAETDGDEPRRADCPEPTSAGGSEPSPEDPGEVTAGSDGSSNAVKAQPDSSGLDTLDEVDASPHAESGARASTETDAAQSGDHACDDGGPVTSSQWGPEEDEAEARDVDSPALDSSGRPQGTSWRVPIYSYGGDTAESWEWIRLRAQENRRDARNVERALRRLIAAVDTGGVEESPRIDGRRLVRELASRRYAIGRAVRRELAMPLVVLAADVSGSCSAVATETLAAALAIAAELRQVLVVRHSNGLVVDVLGAAARPAHSTRRNGYGEEGGGIVDVVRATGCPVAAVVAWGDADAADQYRELCEGGATLYWLDSYAAKHGPRPASSNLRAVSAGWRHQPAGWWQGVNSASATAIALRAMAKGG